jgi:hypothetical protein
VSERAAEIWFWVCLAAMLPATFGMACVGMALRLPIWMGFIGSGVYVVIMLAPMLISTTRDG